MRKILFIIFAVAYGSFHFFYLEKFLKIDIDDAYLCEPAWTFLTTGRVAVPTWRGLHGSEKHEARYGRIFIFSQLPFLLIFGPRPLAVRLPALLSGFLLLWLTYKLGNYLYDRKVATLATFLLSLSGIFFLTTHHGRPDTMLALFYLASFFLFIKARDQNSRKLFFCCGLLSTLSLDVHLNGILTFLSLGLLFLIEFRSQIIHSKNFYFYLLGATLGFLWWIAVHILVNPAVFFENWKGMVVDAGFGPPIFKTLNPLLWLQMEWSRYLSGYWTGPAKRNLLELLIILFCALFIFRNKCRLPVENRMGLYVVFTILLFPLLVPQKTFWYLIYLYPFFMLWIAKVTLHKEFPFKLFPKLLIGVLLLLYMANISVWAVKYANANYELFIKEFKKTIPQGSAVMADLSFWFGFVKEAKNFSSLQDVDAFERKLNLDFLGVLKYWETDYLIVQTDDYNQSGYFRILPFLEKGAVPIGKVKTPFYGAGPVIKGKLKEFTIFKIKK